MSKWPWNPGKDVYEVYQAVALQQGVATDSWDDLEEWNRATWEQTAELVGAELSDEANNLLGRVL